MSHFDSNLPDTGETPDTLDTLETVSHFDSNLPDTGETLETLDTLEIGVYRILRRESMGERSYVQCGRGPIMYLNEFPKYTRNCSAGVAKGTLRRHQVS